jgi:hypothetical protein
LGISKVLIRREFRRQLARLLQRFLGHDEACQNAHAGHKRTGRIGPVIGSDGRRVDSAQPGHPTQEQVGQEPDAGIGDKPDHHESAGLHELVSSQRCQFFATVPADRNQQEDCDRLICHLGKLKRHPQDWNQEPHVEEQQQRLEQVVEHVVGELVQNGGVFHFHRQNPYLSAANEGGGTK